MSRFDRLVGLVVGGLVLLGAVVAWRTIEVGVQAIEMEPAPGAQNVSARTPIQITFDQDILIDDPASALSISPPLTGTLLFAKRTLIFTPDTAFSPQTNYTVSLHSSITNRARTARVAEESWQFQTRAPRVIYRIPVGNGQFQLGSSAPDGSDARFLANVAGTVTDFAISADGNHVAYAASLVNKVTQIWRITREGTNPKLLLECPSAVCFGMVWMPDGKRLLYQRAEPEVANVITKPAQLWWLDVETGETVPLFENDTGYEIAPRISPDGKWVAYVAPIDKSVVLYNLQNGTNYAVATHAYNPVIWSPRSDAIVYVQRDTNSVLLNDFLERFDLATQTRQRIGGQGEIAEHEPTWSPDGAWIAISRSEQLAPGEFQFWQLWLVRADGSGMKALSADDELFFTEPAWSADGKVILYTRIDRKDSTAPPQVWQYDIETQRFQRILRNAQNAQWLP